MRKLISVIITVLLLAVTVFSVIYVVKHGGRPTKTNVANTEKPTGINKTERVEAERNFDFYGNGQAKTNGTNEVSNEKDANTDVIGKATSTAQRVGKETSNEDSIEEVEEDGAVTTKRKIEIKPKASKTEKRELLFCIDYDGGRVNVYDEKIYSDNHIIAEEIAERKINATSEEKLEKIKEVYEKTKDEKTAILHCYPYIEKYVGCIEKLCYIKPKDSKIYFHPDESEKFEITQEKDGRKLNGEKLYHDIFNAICRGEKSGITANCEIVKSEVTAEKNKQYTYLKSRFSTDVSTSKENRKHNIQLSLSKINGSIILPGQTLSFNQKVGTRTAENGFLDAKIIVNGEYTEGIGGGVCQASTTLYNASLLAGLKTESVKGHTLLPSYVLPSFDAMVSYGWSDLVIKNDTTAPVFIKASLVENFATVEIYGAKNEYRIERQSKTVETYGIPQDKTVYDSALKENEEKRISYGTPAIKSEGYLLYYKDGKLVKTEKIREDRYKGKSGIIAKRG